MKILNAFTIIALNVLLIGTVKMKMFAINRINANNAITTLIVNFLSLIVKMMYVNMNVQLINSVLELIENIATPIIIFALNV